MNPLENLSSRSMRTGQYNPPQSEQPKMEPCSVIESRIQGLFAQLSELHDKLDLLEKQVYPVLGPIGIDDTKVKVNATDIPPQSELSSKLMDVSTKLNHAIERVYTLTSRVEL